MDRVSAEKRSEIMSKIKASDTKPEMAVRKLLHSLGYRYRTHDHSLSGRPDLVFTKRKKLIFVHGCYWHFHRQGKCPKSHIPKSNRGYWLPKLKGNAARDKEHRQELEEAGWDVKVVWECEIAAMELERLAEELTGFLGPTKWTPQQAPTSR